MKIVKYNVCYGDSDQMGIVYYANYLKIFEYARMKFLHEINMTYLELEKRDIYMPIIEAHVEYKQPALVEDVLLIELWPNNIKRASLRFDYIIRRKDIILTRGYTRHACIGKNKKPKRIPNDIINGLVENG